MLRAVIAIILVGIVANLFGMVPSSRADIDPVASSWNLSCDFPEFLPLTFFLISSGNGPPLSACFGTDCEQLSACITVTLIDDETHNPLVGVQRDMVRIGEMDPGFFWCPSPPVPNCADDDSNADGEVRFTRAYRGSGSADSVHIWVWSHGAWHALDGSLPFHSVSVDINGDGFINLADVAMFASHYWGTYSERIDFCHDGLFNGSDVTFLAMGYFANCQ